MSLQHIKTPMVFGLNTFAERKVADAIQKLGKSLPCTVASVVSSGIVTVNFEVNAAPWTLPQVTVPILYPEYIRYPIQVGDKGACVAFDARLGGLSGLGSGTPNLSAPGNLAALAFDFLGSSAWSAPDDPQAVVIYGPNGVILRDLGSKSVQTITPTEITITTPEYNLTATTSITLGVGGNTIVINGSGVSINGRQFLAHEHSGVMTGGGITGGVV